MQNQALMKMLLQNQVASNQVLLEATGGTPGPTSAGGAASTGNGRGGSEGGSGGRGSGSGGFTTPGEKVGQRRS